MTTARRRPALRLACTLALAATTARAAPQWNTAVSAGVTGVGDSGAWETTKFFGGVRGDVLFLRDGPRSAGIGPSIAITTAGFSDVRGNAGTMVLVPLGDLWGIGVEPSGYVRSSDAGVFPGIAARAWFGIQTYNYDGAYAPRGGITLGYTQDIGGSDSHAIVIAAEIDGLILALPFALLYQSLRGHPEE